MDQEKLKERIVFLESENKFLKGEVRHLEKKLKKKESVILGLKTTNEHQKERLEKLKDNIVFLP